MACCVFVRFLPPACQDYIAVWLDDDGAPVQSSRKGTRRCAALLRSCVSLGVLACLPRLDFCWWLLAWDRYALAAAITKQMTYQQAMEHKQLIVSIATDAILEDRSPQEAVAYDELVRCDKFGHQLLSRVFCC